MWTSLIFALLGVTVANAAKPNIVYIMADDIGYSDIGYVNDEVISPNLDALANDGVKLTQGYAMAMCTPSRSAFLTGMQPYKTKMMSGVISDTQKACTPTDLKLMPQYFKDAGYSTHMLGKWHLGFCNEACIPHNRGFDTFYGLWTGAETFWTHLAGSGNTLGYDWRDNMEADLGANGTYMSDLLGARAVKLIEESDGSEPMFMFLSYTNPHTPIEAPQEYIDMYPDTFSPPTRRTYLAMITAMDKTVGDVVDALKAAGQFENTIFIFSGDNGGYNDGNNRNGILNGYKGSMFEGGSRTPMFIAGPGIQSGVTNEGMFSFLDWIPTMMGLIGEEIDTEGLDGIDQSAMFTEGAESERDELIYNIDLEPMPFFGQAAIRQGDFKLIWGNTGYGLGSGTEAYHIGNYPPNRALLAQMPQGQGGPPPSNGGDLSRKRRGAPNFTYLDFMTIQAVMNVHNFDTDTMDPSTGLTLFFNLADDPSELNNLAEDPAYADQILAMKNRIIEAAEDYNKPDGYRFDMVEAAEPRFTGGIYESGFCEDVPMTMDA